MFNSKRYHRGVGIEVNLKPTVEILVAHLQRCIDLVRPEFTGVGTTLGQSVQKRWYSKQLATVDYTWGSIFFTVTNNAVLSHDFDINKGSTQVPTSLEYSLHVKQNQTNILGKGFVSGSVRFKDVWTTLTADKVDFTLYGGSDMESALLFRDLITEVTPQLAAFAPNATTLIGQNKLSLIPFLEVKKDVVN